MSVQPILTLPDLPFCIGACPEPRNPAPLPDAFPIELCVNLELARLELAVSADLEALLQTAYSVGLEMGTPSDNTALGMPYVTDFIEFIRAHAGMPGRALEIGAGVGYLSRRLLDSGWRVDSLEPGTGYEHHWARHGVPVINDFFPSRAAQGPYDLIVFYTVLEHIRDTRAFLRTVVDHLAPGGRIILGVPDCSIEIENGDPGMLLHEHFQYFTAASLERTLADAGLRAVIRPSEYGRSIHACARPCADIARSEVTRSELLPLQRYGEKVDALRSAFRRRLADLLARGTVAIYCPGRALALLPADREVRFVDDAVGLHGKYFPPFQGRIESRNDLLGNPPDALVVMSRTFGRRIAAELAPLLPHTTILLPDDVLNAE